MIILIKVTCGWCHKEFQVDKGKGKHDTYPVRVCPHCGRTVAASRKELIDNVVGRKHIHSDSRSGDVV